MIANLTKKAGMFYLWQRFYVFLADNAAVGFMYTAARQFHRS